MEKRFISGMKIRGSFNGLKCLLPVALCILYSCVSRGTPEGILTQPEMVQILIHVYTDEEKVNRLGLVRDSAEAVYDSLKVRTFRSLDVDDSAFNKSLDYYTGRPREMEMIYTAVVDSLQLREQRAQGIELVK
jgi:hypothetical protein